jgi:acyl-CoA thioesterase I
MKNKATTLLCALVLVYGCAFSQKVACVGNSITYGATVAQRVKNNYPKQLDDLLGGAWDVRNFGVSGTTMLKNADNPYWNKNQYTSAKSLNPDYVIIELGTNDSKDYNWNAYGVDFEKDYSAMIREFAALPSTPTIIICKAPKAFSSSWSINDNTINTQINPIIQAIRDKGVNLIVADLYAMFKDHPELMSDGIHPNKEGATLMAQTFRNILLSNPPNNHSNAAPAGARLFTESVTESENADLFNVYPVPSEDKIIIETPPGQSTVWLRGVDGTLKMTRSSESAQRIELLKEQFGPGIFLLTIEHSSGKATKKVVFK